MNNAFNLTNVTCSLKSREAGASCIAVNDLTLDIQKSTILGVVGPSGAGKSTLLRILAGLTQPSSGTCEGSEGDSQTLGMVFQGDSLYPWLDVYENILFPIRYGRPRRRLNKTQFKAKVDALLDAIGLPSATFAHRYPSELSGGERRRVAIAACLMAEANVLLLDEPTTGLDDMNKWRFQELLRRLWCIHHFTCVLVTHDLEEAIFVSDQIAVMREGCLVELVRVPFPADRKNSLRYEPQFASMRRHLSDLLFSKEGAS